MKVIMYGTRGSIPISNPESIRYGGNTTCLRILSDCIPEGRAWVTDSGSGYVPLSRQLLAEKIGHVHIGHTHWHHDHTQGLLLAAPTYMRMIKTHLYGPVDSSGVGPEEVFGHIMTPPFHPVHSELHESHFTFTPFKFPQTIKILVHPEGGIRTMKVVDFERLLDKNSNIPCGKGKFELKEFLVISMYLSNHPERTVSYRFDEMPTGKSFVFLTDHENHDVNPVDLRNHLKGADLLIMDSQYTREKYNSFTAGYGHATPDYCVRTAEQVNAKRLGLTHHDPSSIDADIDGILEEALRARNSDLSVFACRDYEEIEV